MPAAKLDIYIEQAATFSRTLTFQDASANKLDLTNNVFTAMLRKNIGDQNPIVSFSCVVQDQTQDATKGQVIVSLSATDTAAIPLKIQRSPERVTEEFCYDIDRTYPDGTVERILEGIANVSPAATHP